MKEGRVKGKGREPKVHIEDKGKTVTLDDIKRKMPVGVENIYVKVEDNKAYWTMRGKSGAVELF